MNNNKIKQQETMTDEDVNLVTEFLSENITDKNAKLRELEKESLTDKAKFPVNVLNKGELHSGIATVNVNSNTGEHSIQKVVEKVNPLGIEDANKEDILEAVDDEVMNKSLEDFGLSDESAIKFSKVLLEFTKTGNFKLTDLPEEVMQMVKNITPSPNMQQLRISAKHLLTYFAQEIRTGQEFINMEQAVKKVLDETLDIGEMYTDYLREKMEVNLLTKADELETAGQADKANQLREISKNYTDSYNYTSLIKALNDGSLKRLDKKVKKITRLMSEFNYKYKDSMFEIKAIELIIPVLMRKAEISFEDANLIVVAICEYTKNFTPSNIAEHSFMYYTVNNILSLDYISSKIDFQTEVKENLIKLVKAIHERGLKHE